MGMHEGGGMDEGRRQMNGHRTGMQLMYMWPYLSSFTTYLTAAHFMQARLAEWTDGGRSVAPPGVEDWMFYRTWSEREIRTKARRQPLG